ncbi:MAG TPA: ABC transporter permease [Stellaceae bacterium]|jgi:ABC-2 type transport system permease protein/lipopolysaccharide transport system permease protein|nr:ABC transporter permease [Stellaceae bacterium]
MQTTLLNTALAHHEPDEILPPLPSRSARAMSDLLLGLRKSWLWTEMAMQDIRLRYRGSVLGPFWLTLSTGILVGSMGVIYSQLFHTDIVKYLPYLAIGLVVWQFISSLITEGCQTFIAVQNVILQAPMPFSVHVFRVVYRNFIVLGHNFVIVVAVLLIFGVHIDWDLLLIPPAFLLLAINGVFICIFFGMVSARFRDVPPIVASFVQVLFFVTPIFWPVEALGRYKDIAEYSPMFAAIDVIRAPLLGVPFAPHSWLLLIATTLIISALTFAFFARLRSRIAYWI